jgi:predicted acyltransferase (DUF342 family)
MVDFDNVNITNKLTIGTNKIKLSKDGGITADNIAVRGIIRGTEINGNILDVRGDLRVTGNISSNDVTLNSSQEIKQDISSLTKEDAYSLIDKLEPVKFVFKDDALKRENIGFVAEQVPDIVASGDRTRKLI